MNVFVRYYPIFVVFGIIAGFLYQWILLFCFSIEVTNYFSLNDYLHLAITQMTTVIALLGVYCMLNFLFLPLFPPLQEMKKNWSSNRSIIYAAALALLSTIVGIYKEDKSYSALGIASLTILIPIWSFLKNYVKNGFQIFHLFFIFFLFFIIIIILSLAKVDNIKNIHNTEDFINIYLSQRSNLKITSPIKLITLNSQYCFLYDADRGKVIIVRVENIDYIVKTRTKAVRQSNG